MTHGQEQWFGDCQREEDVLGGGGKRGKNWDNWNSIINEIYFLKRTIYRETTIEWMKPRIKSMIWNIRKKKTSNHNSEKKRESKKIKGSVRSLQDNFRHSNIHITEMPEGEEKEQDIRNLFEKIMEKMP